MSSGVLRRRNDCSLVTREVCFAGTRYPDLGILRSYRPCSTFTYIVAADLWARQRPCCLAGKAWNFDTLATVQREPGNPTAPTVRRMIEQIAARLNRLPKRSLAALATLLVLATGAVDYVSNADVSFSVIYVIPIAIAAWTVGEGVAFVLCGLSVVLWVGGDIAAGYHYESALIPLWNGIIRLSFYLMVVKLLGALRKSREHLEMRADQKAKALMAEIAAREVLEGELLRISEREQRRFGQDIHDSLCQHLTATALAGQVLTERLTARGEPEAGRAARLVELIEDSIILSRSLAKGLNPIEMGAQGLMEALEEFATSTSELFMISCRFECEYPVLFNDTDTATHLYRIAQEAVSNAIKHGKAKNVLIQLDIAEKGKLLSVTDDGTGCVLFNGESKGMGLRIMSYRARIVGGSLEISKGEHVGVRILCLVPDVKVSSER